MAALRSKGALLLARVGLGQAEKALKAGVSRIALNRWEMGHSRPSEAARDRVKELWGIPPIAWDLLPGEPDPPGMPPAPVEDDRPLLDDEELGSASQSVEGRVNEVERALRELMLEVSYTEGTPARERATVLETVTRTLGSIAKMKGTFELGARLFKLPIYVLFRGRLLDALKPCPTCMARVAAEFEQADEEHGK